MIHEVIINAACPCPVRPSVKCLGKWNYVSAIIFTLKNFNRKNSKTFVKSLTCTFQLSNWNVSRDKNLVKKIKFGDNPSTDVVPKNNYDPSAPNDTYFGNDSMNRLKRDLQKFLPSSGFFVILRP